MHLLFLDESGQVAERRFFALGGVAVRDTDWHRLRDGWQETLEAHGWPFDREVKWHGIARARCRPRWPTPSSAPSPTPPSAAT